MRLTIEKYIKNAVKTVKPVKTQREIDSIDNIDTNSKHFV